jgi:WD40 repeat protein
MSEATEDFRSAGPEDQLVTVEVFPVAIGRFEHACWADLDVDGQVGRLLELLAEFGATHNRWAGLTSVRDADAVERRLADWAYPSEPCNSILYWVGHGWTDGHTVSLAHAMSPPDVRTFGVTPGQLADPVRSRQATADKRWAIVVVDACQSARFVDEMSAELLTGRLGDVPPAVLLVGVSGEGATSLGRFTDALRRSLHGTYKADTQIPLVRLATDLRAQLTGASILDRTLPDQALVRSVPPAASLSGALDAIRYLEDVLAELTPDQRQHFISKAQGAEEGEVSWFFEGRSAESERIASWLRTATTGLLVVTGTAGTGKSALLGNLLVHSLPELRGALLRRGLIASLPAACQPPDNVFDLVIHLSGLTVGDAIRRIAESLDLGELPSARDPLSGRANDLDFLAGALGRRTEPLTMLVDALDECTDPLDLAGSLLARIADEPGVRLIVGTRPSTRDSPDHIAVDYDLLRALSPGDQPDEHAPVVVERDAHAVRRYVARRLTEARDHPRRRRPINDTNPDDATIAAVAEAVAAGDQEFLFARLAVHEMVHTPNLLTSGRARTLRRLLSGNHRQLLDTALRRLAFIDDTFPLLLEALAHARGRGMPIADDIWGTAAAALDDESPEPLHRWHITALLDEDPAYVAVDTEGGRTVYRLAHRTFVEHFVDPDSKYRPEQVRRIGRALLDTARRAASGTMPAYLSVHLPAHVAAADLWDELGESPQVLDDLDPDRVTEEVTKTLFGRRPVPAAVAGVVTARPELRSADRADIAGLRHLATLTHTEADTLGEIVGTWGVSATSIRRSTVHLRMPGHRGSVNALCVLPDPDSDGRRLLASAGDDGTVRVWEATTSTPVGEPMTGHHGTVEAICTLHGPTGATLLATGGSDGTVRLWDAATSRPFGPPISGHRGAVYGICSVTRRSGGTLLASSGDDGTIRLWDPFTARPTGQPLMGHVGTVFGICVMDGPAGPLLASTGQDGTVRVWNPMRGIAGAVMSSHTGPLWGITTMPGPEGTALLATTGYDGTIRRWDPLRGDAVGTPIAGHRGRAWGICLVPGPEDVALLATSGDDGIVRLWDAEHGTPFGRPMAGHSGAVWRVVALPEPAGLLATAGIDGTIRVWDPTAAADGPEFEQPERVNGVVALPFPDGPILATTRSNGIIELWDPTTGRLVRPPLAGHRGAVHAVCTVPRTGLAAVPLLASGGEDGTIRLWDPVTGTVTGPPMTGHAGIVHGLCVVPMAGSLWLASAGEDGTVRLWDPATGTSARSPMRGHSGIVYGLCVLPRPQGAPLLATAGQDGTVRFWDPFRAAAVGPTITGHIGSVYGVCPVPGHDETTLLATTGQDGTTRLWDTATGAAIGAPMSVGTGSLFGICTIDFDGLGPYLAATCDDGTVRLWKPATGDVVRRPLRGHVGRVRAICRMTGPSGTEVLVTTGADGSIRMHDAERGVPLGVPMGGHPDSVDVVAILQTVTGAAALVATVRGRASWWDPQRAQARPVGTGPDTVSCATAVTTGGHSLAVVIGRTDGTLQTVDPVTGEPLTDRMPAGIGAVQCLVPLDNGNVVAGGRLGAMIRWDIGTGQPVGEPWQAHAGPIHGLSAPDPGGKMLASAGHDGIVTVWDLTSQMPSLIANAIGHSDRVWSVSVTPPAPGSPAILASGGADTTVRLWDAITGNPTRRPLTGHSDQVSVVRFVATNDGTRVLISGSHDGTIRLWDPLSGEELRRISLGIPINALEQKADSPQSHQRTGGGVSLVVGTRDGAIVVDMHRSFLRATGK